MFAPVVARVERVWLGLKVLGARLFALGLFVVSLLPFALPALGLLAVLARDFAFEPSTALLRLGTVLGFDCCGTAAFALAVCGLALRDWLDLAWPALGDWLDLAWPALRD